MSDFFGGILDNLRSTGNDVNGFFGGALDSALEHGIAAGNTPANNVNKLYEAASLAKLNSEPTAYYERPYEPPQNKTRPAQSEDFSQIEQQWLRRIARFSELSGVVSPPVKE